MKKIPDENDIPPEYHFHPDYALYGVKFLSYFTQKNFIRPGSGRLDEIIPSDFTQTEVDEIWRCSYLVGVYAVPQHNRVPSRPEMSKRSTEKAEGCTQHLASIPTQRHCALNMDTMDSNKVVSLWSLSEGCVFSLTT